MALEELALKYNIILPTRGSILQSLSSETASNASTMTLIEPIPNFISPSPSAPFEVVLSPISDYSGIISGKKGFDAAGDMTDSY
jgi:hypothetical protein